MDKKKMETAVVNSNLTNDGSNRILECKDLRISFKTNNGTVKAVRGINFNLYRGRTLAIVGESGSGKSVTSKAIMGILAGNKIVENGHVFFDGRDLLQLNDREMSSVRGSRISMIFQDPMSSLNPIMRVGNQLTEALTLKNASVRSWARGLYKKRLKLIKREAIKLHPNDAAEISRLIKVIKNHKVELEEGDVAKLSVIIGEVSKNILDNYILNVKGMVIRIQEIIKNDLASLDAFDPKTFKVTLSLLKKVSALVSNPLADIKDDQAYVLYGNTKQYLNKFNELRKDEVAEAAAILKAEGKAEKVLTVAKAVKKRSFSSEFSQTSGETFGQLRELYLNFIAHLESIINNEESIRNEFREAEIIANLRRLIKESKDVMRRSEAKERAINILREVGIQDAENRFKQYPFELSGGMRQRIVIAIALLANPDILICDEPTTALDVTIQAQILDLINTIKRERNLSIIFITHNLGVVANMADDVAVMYAGKIVEYGGVNDIFYNPKHPYTWALLSSMPDLTTKERLESIPGTPPNMIIPPKGDAFAARNKYALKIDFEEEPPFFVVSETHQAATWLLHEDAPKVVPPKAVLKRMEEMKIYQASLKKKGGAANE